MSHLVSSKVSRNITTERRHMAANHLPPQHELWQSAHVCFVWLDECVYDSFDEINIQVCFSPYSLQYDPALRRVFCCCSESIYVLYFSISPPLSSHIMWKRLQTKKVLLWISLVLSVLTGGAAGLQRRGQRGSTSCTRSVQSPSEEIRNATVT